MTQNPPKTSFSTTLEQLERDVVTLARPDGRMVGTPGHARARAYLIERLGALSLRPYGAQFELPYRVGRGRFANVVGVVPGRQPELAPMLIAAHYDTCGPLPGADDNAAAIAIALRVAEELLANPGPRDLIVAFFDGEEPPHYLSDAMGSIHWYHHQRTTPVHCAVVLDLVGHDVPIPGREDLVFVTGMESDPGLVFADLDQPGLRVQPALNRYIGDLSDHHVFRVNRRPYLFLSCGRWAHYHQASDTPDKLNYTKMAAIAELSEALIRRASAAPLVGPFEGGDSLPVELAGAARHFGVKLRGRLGLNAFVAMAMRGFGL